MKTRLLLIIIPCLFLISCTGSADKAAKQKADSLAAMAHMDSLMNASKAMMKQDSIDAAKKADSAKKATDSTKAKQ
ncbi:MAG TPA: hypothetical protein VK783_00800 [Bacteroidia bacterium]|jgi:hypothetical protein|nr:hypothetical protein [Bacteroidia bacterium]